MGRWHGEAVRQSGARVAAVVDSRRSAAADLARRFPGSAVAEHLAELLDGRQIDVLHICTPPKTHAELAAAALDAGIHTIVEKPLTLTHEASADLLSRAKQAGVLLCPVHQFVYQDGVIQAGALMSRMSPLRHMDVTICSAGGEGQTEESRAAILADILPHPLSLAQRLLDGNVDQTQWVAQHPTEGELVALGSLNGTTVRILASLNARPTRCELSLRGDGGSVHADLFHGFATFRGPQVSRQRKMLAPFLETSGSFAAAGTNLGLRIMRREPAYPGLRPLMKAFYRAIRSGGESPISPAETLSVARAREDILRVAGLDIECSGV